MFGPRIFPAPSSTSSPLLELADDAGGDPVAALIVLLDSQLQTGSVLSYFKPYCIPRLQYLLL